MPSLIEEEESRVPQVAKIVEQRVAVNGVEARVVRERLSISSAMKVHLWQSRASLRRMLSHTTSPHSVTAASPLAVSRIRCSANGRLFSTKLKSQPEHSNT